MSLESDLNLTEQEKIPEPPTETANPSKKRGRQPKSKTDPASGELALCEQSSEVKPPKRRYNMITERQRGVKIGSPVMRYLLNHPDEVDIDPDSLYRILRIKTNCMHNYKTRYNKSDFVVKKGFPPIYL